MSFVSGKFTAGQVTGLTTAAAKLDATQGCREVMFQNDSGNAGNLLVGDVNGQYLSLTPGQIMTVPIISLQLIYVKMSTGTGTVNWVARD